MNPSKAADSHATDRRAGGRQDESSTPQVTIIIPSLNQGRFLPKALESIQFQRHGSFEVIVVDGRSTDVTLEVLKGLTSRMPELRWVSEQDEGPADAVNKGLSMARGTYGGILSADDQYVDGAISEAVDALIKEPDTCLVTADTIIQPDADGLPERAFGRAAPTLENVLARSCVIHQGSTFFRMDAARAVHGWSRNYFCADSHFWLRMLFRQPAIRLDRDWSIWRQHPGQRDREAERMWTDWGRMLDEMPELRDAPARLRRAASAGRRLVALSYNPHRSPWAAVGQTWIAVMTYPPAAGAVWSWDFFWPGLNRIRTALQRTLDLEKLAPGFVAETLWQRAKDVSESGWKSLKAAAHRLFRKSGFDIVRHRPDDSRYSGPSHDTRVPLPEGAKEVLRSDHPALLSLRERYARVADSDMTLTMWNPRYLSRELDLRSFRGDNAYVWQFRNLGYNARNKYFFYLRDLLSRDRLKLFDRLKEDGAFGCWTFGFPGLPTVSRDLLDSINEIYFLDRTLDLSNREGWSVLDVGAGYGRLAHRMLEGLSGIDTYYCVDAVPESTYLCDYYLRHRGCRDRARVIPFDRLDEDLPPPGAIDLAVSIHCLSEMSLSAVRQWIRRLARLQVPSLLIVPNDSDRLLTFEGDGRRLDFAPLLAIEGYVLETQEPVFPDPTFRDYMGVNDHFFLFRRAGTA